MPFLIAFLAGISTILGYLFIYLNNKNNRVLIMSLGFASGVMFFISIYDLIPTGINIFNNTYNMVFSLILCIVLIVVGIILSSYLNKDYNINSLYHVGILSMIGIIIHNIPEGIATFLTTSYNLKLGLVLSIAIACHNIPEGISISIPIYYSTNNKLKAFIYTFISGMSEFIGAIIAYLFLGGINELFLGYLYLIIAGIMIYISLQLLLPTSLKYDNKRLTFISFILGIIFIYISIILIK